MNRTSLSVIALAVGAVLIIGLYNVYKPQVKGIADKVFHKPVTALEHTSTTPKGTPVTNEVDYTYNGQTLRGEDLYPGYRGAFKAKGKFGEKNKIDWYNFSINHMPYNWNIANFSTNDNSQNFTFSDDGTVQHVNVLPNPIQGNINYVDSTNGKTLGTYHYKARDAWAIEHANDEFKTHLSMKGFQITASKNLPKFPSGYHIVGGNGQSNHGLTFKTYGDGNYTVSVAK